MKTILDPGFSMLDGEREKLFSGEHRRLACWFRLPAETLFVRGAHASRVLVSVSRRDELLKI